MDIVNKKEKITTDRKVTHLHCVKQLGKSTTPVNPTKLLNTDCETQDA